jgi:hypothetical protein
MNYEIIKLLTPSIRQMPTKQATIAISKQFFEQLKKYGFYGHFSNATEILINNPQIRRHRYYNRYNRCEIVLESFEIRVQNVKKKKSLDLINDNIVERTDVDTNPSFTIKFVRTNTNLRN